MTGMDPALLESELKREIGRRRSFAIISHPDAGKTTLTEKLLLYCGAIREAGEVKAKAQRRKTVSDWMELEQQRGISVSSSVLQYEYKNLKVNILDTPGHQDFSEDTYRTLMAADSAVMVIDGAKGVEAQTRKLFEVCRMRGIPIFTFINKMDRETRDPFELMEEIEKLLQLQVKPVTWPVGTGDRFRGVYHLLEKRFYFFEPSDKAGQEAKERVLDCEPDDPVLLNHMDEEAFKKLQDELLLVRDVLGPFDRQAFEGGQESPALFGSARNNFGIRMFLDVFDKFAPPPRPKPAEPQSVDPFENRFTGFVFKIQANMDKAHRDRIAFIRICSGRFERDMDVKSSRLEKPVRLTHSKQFLAQDRSTVDVAFAGDIVGIHDPGHFKIGDTLFEGAKVKFDGIPQFSPECFGKLRLKDPLKRKQLQKGIQQLCEEGLVQMFVEPHVGLQDPILGVVGVLQFDVMVFRIKDEYNVEAVLDRLPYSCVRWVRSSDPSLVVKDLDLRVPKALDSNGDLVLLFKSDWELEYTKKNSPASLLWSNTAFLSMR